MAKKPRRPSDPIALAKAIGDIATGQTIAQQESPTDDDIRRVMSALGKKGGPKGGKARAESLSAKKRHDIAKKAALSRWKRRK